MYGWVGKILFINLSDSRIEQISTQPYAEKYLGGRGIASKIYWDTVAPEVEPFDADNRLIFMTGPLVGTGVQGATRLSVISKSPMTLPEGYCYGSLGGFVAAELKKAGFDGVVIEGHAPTPVYLWIHDKEVEIRDASALWGQGAYNTGRILQGIHGKKVHFITTGVAGERKVRTTVVIASHHSAASCGFGSVMGSKNLKALAVRGTHKISVANPQDLKELTRRTIQMNKGLWASLPIGLKASPYSDQIVSIGKGGCYQCGLDCNRHLFRYGKRLEGYRKCQSKEYYAPWKYSIEAEPLETIFDAPTLANDYSIATEELQNMVDWLYACYKAGVFTEQETGLPLSKIGTREFLEKLLHSISYRVGFGDILAEGMVRIGNNVSDEARSLFSHTVAPIGLNDMAPPRRIVAHALLYSMEPRVHSNLMHEILGVLGAWSLNQMNHGATPVTTKLFRDIAKAFWGSEEAAYVCNYEGKALASKKVQNRTYLKESLGLCDLGYPITYSLNTTEHIGDPDLEAKIYTAVTDNSNEEFDIYAERIFTMQRLIMLREGRKVPESDFPEEFNFTEPFTGMPNPKMAIAPDPSGEVISCVGNVLDREKFEKMLKEYYLLRGWHEENGLPKKETLEALDFDV